MRNRTRILIADDHNLMAELCKRLLETEFDVVGVVGDGRSLVRAAAELKPDLIVLDIAMPILNGLDAGQQVKEILPAIKLVYLTMNPDVELAAEALARGARGYLLKTCATAEMELAIHAVLQGKIYLSKALSRDAIDCLQWEHKELVSEQERLTNRQREVLQLLVEGNGMKEVGYILNMTSRTVAYHKYRMMEVLGAKSNAELIKFAIRNHIVAA
jgi:DNA-binding NarL/FixJ family response regulator